MFRWEVNNNYCDKVKQIPPYDKGPRLMDITDASIFDYVIGNADRHHYESFQNFSGESMMIMFDNGKRQVQLFVQIIIFL